MKKWENEKEWKDAMIKEYQSIMKNDVWDVVPSVDVIVTSECIHLYLLYIVTQCLFWDVLESSHAPMFLSRISIM